MRGALTIENSKKRLKFNEQVNRVMQLNQENSEKSIEGATHFPGRILPDPVTVSHL